MAPHSFTATKAETPVADFVSLSSPIPQTPPLHVDQEPPSEKTYESMLVNTVLFTSVGLALLHPMQYGWTVSQVNLSTFHNEDACNARPVAPGTCLMFPGHSSGSWKWVVNLWIVGGVVGSIGCAKISDHFGRKKALMMNAIIMIIGAVVQASAPSLTAYAIGRFISGVASGAGSALPNGYINEISPPHLRNRLGSMYQISLCFFIILVGSSFFFANTSSGWRYIGGFPIVLASLFLLGSTKFMVESPVWLLNQGRREEAEHEIARLFGEHNIELAMSWLNPVESNTASTVEQGNAIAEHLESAGNPWKALFSAEFREQTIIALMLSLGQQLSGINVVFLYSSAMFKDAGLSDDRIGSMVVNVVNVLPTLFAGGLGTRYGNRRMILIGHIVMMLSCVGIMVALSANSPVVSIVFTALYVTAFAITLGPLVFVVLTAMFPNALRASGTSLCLFVNWLGVLVIGVGYPYVSDALDDLAFLPFVVLLAGFGFFLFKFLPETAGKTSEEIQDIFRRKRKALEVQ
ncbi:hypothetical protein Poli38472_007859 [Pythium oligandrum]|uniref:Hexose transporter 1 n=1 Tax=Pythium oligandrum TaxID=41045 RepID=A0A8K1CSY8_PYTOL|nr:hypothetical protein Poli38472_007859 [Pythium oligandrum]|eukprot:TMW68187.1 hypothetical protein Poli38472_007859 [Pythium oligandrum]